METKSAQQILQERLDEDERDWKPFDPSKKGFELVQIWIENNFNWRIPDTSLQGYEQRMEEMDRPFSSRFIELRSPKRDLGYVFFVGGGSEKAHGLSKALVERKYFGMLKNTKYYFLDLENDLSGLYWETDLNLKGKRDR